MKTPEIKRMIREYEHGFRFGRLQERLRRPHVEPGEMSDAGLHQSFINGYLVGRESQRHHAVVN